MNMVSILLRSWPRRIQHKAQAARFWSCLDARKGKLKVLILKSNFSPIPRKDCQELTQRQRQLGLPLHGLEPLCQESLGCSWPALQRTCVAIPMATCRCDTDAFSLSRESSQNGTRQCKVCQFGLSLSVPVWCKKADSTFLALHSASVASHTAAQQNKILTVPGM